MIIVQLVGGIGNQMFQYAAARRISYINNTPLKLDISWFEKSKLRNYNLKCFNIIEDFASPRDIQLIKELNRKKNSIILMGFVEKFIPYYKCWCVKQKYFHYDPNLLNLSDNIYLKGYWQSEKYFKDIDNIIRKEYIIKFKPDSYNIEMSNLIKSLESVSIHIRRGDYIKSFITKKAHGSCSLEYYHNAIKKITKIIKKPHFFVFSDDINWTKHNLKISHPVTFIIQNSKDKDFRDLQLMSFCKYYIISNSSFSWWGAWLNRNPNKIVIAPKKWFNSPILVGLINHFWYVNTKDLLPASWHKL